LLTMSAAPSSPCRTYIVYHHGLFAQGVRSVLETRRAVEIVGMESDVAKALKAVQSLQPEVIIVEESTGKHQPMRLGAFLNGSTGCRVVTLSLNHEFATVYQRNRMAATDPVDLVRAIQGVGKRHIPGPDRPDPKASMLFQLGSGRNGDESRSGKKSRVRRTRKEEPTQTETVSRTTRARKGG
jgi:chemotaxis response regulator CheB